jgi:hypothetical protein
MIVLDEQLLGYGLQEQIARWYRGAVIDITQLRPGSVIKDDAIPALLRSARGPTFVTINVDDFWRRLSPDNRFSVVCVALPDSHADEIPELLRRLFATQPFRTRKRRLGKIARIGRREVRYYAVGSRAVRVLSW